MPEKMSGNKGEWSELYAFFKLLSDGRVYAADEKVKKIEDVYYPILKIIREEYSDQKIEYEIGQQDISITFANSCISKVSRSELNNRANYLLKQIAEHSNSFEVEEIAKFANGINVTKIKAPSTDTTDITLRIEDINTGFTTDAGFSNKDES